MYYGLRRETIPGAAVRHTCPKCRSVVVGTAFQFVDTFVLLHLFPLGSVRNTYVACANCGIKLQTPLGLDDLERMRDLQIDEFLSYSPSFVFKFLAVTALFLCWTPFLGTIIAAIALLGTYHFNGWPKKIAITALAISVVPTAFAIVGLSLGW